MWVDIPTILVGVIWVGIGIWGYHYYGDKFQKQFLTYFCVGIGLVLILLGTGVIP